MKKRCWLLTLCLLIIALCSAARAERTITMTVNGSASTSQNVLSNENVTLVIEAPGATAVRLRDGNEDNWYYYDGREWNTDYIEASWTYNSGAKTVYAQARYDSFPEGTNLWEEDREDLWQTGAESARFTLYVSAEGEMNPPAAAWVGASTVARGETLTMRISGTQGRNEWFWVDVGRVLDEGDEIGWMDHYNMGDDLILTLPTHAFDPGTYEMDVFAGAVGWDNKSTALRFTVTEPAQAPGAMLSVSRPEVRIQEAQNIYGYIPDADRIGFMIRKQEDPTWWNREEREGPFGVLERWGFPDKGTYIISLLDLSEETAVEIREASVTVSQDALSGRLTIPNLSGIPKRVSTGEGVNAVLEIDENASGFDLDLEYCQDSGDREELLHFNRTLGSGSLTPEMMRTIHLPATLFQREGIYRLQVGVWADRYEGNGAECYFLCRDGEPEAQLTLTVNGGTGDLASWPSGRGLDIRVQAPENVTAVRLWKNGYWDYRGNPREGLRWEEGFGDGDYMLIAQATTADPIWRADGFDWENFQWEDLDWSLSSDAVRVHSASQGTMQIPEVTLSAASVARGEIIAAIITPQRESEWYWAELMTLRREEDQCWYETIRHLDGNGQNQLRIHTLDLEPGDYYLRIGIDAEGWAGRDRVIPIIVREPEGELPEAMLDFSRETMQASENLTVYASAPGCDHFRLDIRWDRDPYWEDGRDDWKNDSISWGWGCGCGGTYTFTLSYWQPGAQEAGTITKTLTVTSEGALDQPEMEGVPAVLSLGEGIRASFQAIDGAEWYNVGIRYSENGWDWEDLVNEERDPGEDGATALVFGPEIFSRTGTYQIWVDAAAVGVDNGYREAQMEVIDPATISDSLVLKINGETDGAQAEVYLHENVLISVDAPENVTAVRIRNAYNEWEYRWCGDDAYEWWMGAHQGGDDTYIAQASTDRSIVDWAEANDGSLDGFDWSGLTWSMTSAPVTMHVIYCGDLEAPEITFPNGTAVEWGNTLDFTLTPVENAYGYGVQIRKARDSGEWSEPVLDMEITADETTLLQIPTDALEPGNYMLAVDPRRYGWHGDQERYAFTVLASAGWTAEPLFRADRAEALTLETVTFSVRAPGAERVKLCFADAGNVWQETEGESLIFRVGMNWVRTYDLYAYAIYPDQEDWQPVGETVYVSVTAPNGGVYVRALTGPDTARTDETVTFEAALDFSEAGGTGHGECWLSDENGQIHDMEVSETTDGGVWRVTCRIPAETLAPGLYYVTVYALPDRAGYALGMKERAVTITEGTPAGTLTASKNPVEIFENFTLTVNAPGATAVAVYEDGWWDYAAGSFLEVPMNTWGDGETVYYAKYTTAAITPDAPDFDWETVEWDGLTNAVTVYTNPPSYALEVLRFTVKNRAVIRGKELEITVLNENSHLENVAYGAHLLPVGGNFSGSSWFGADADKKILVNTAEVEPGEYWLEVSANCISCYGVSDRIQVTVLPRPAASTVLTLPAGLRVISEEAFAGVAAEKIIVPAGVTEIGSRAFADCPNLIELELPEGITSFAADALDGSGTIFLYGEPGSDLEAYAEACDGLRFIPATD